MGRFSAAATPAAASRRRLAAGRAARPDLFPRECRSWVLLRAGATQTDSEPPAATGPSGHLPGGRPGGGGKHRISVNPLPAGLEPTAGRRPAPPTGPGPGIALNPGRGGVTRSRART